MTDPTPPLGPLPEPGIDTAGHAGFRVRGFTADQMRAAMLQERAAERERWRTLLSDVADQTRHPDYDWPLWLCKEVATALEPQRAEPEKD